MTKKTAADYQKKYNEKTFGRIKGVTKICRGKPCKNPKANRYRALPLSEFLKHPKNKDGLMVKCKICQPLEYDDHLIIVFGEETETNHLPEGEYTSYMTEIAVASTNYNVGTRPHSLTTLVTLPSYVFFIFII